jgi:large subunit ribosomal protein L3
MALGLVGRKCGMTRIFTEDGVAIPVTVIEVESNWVTQVKQPDKEGFSAVQVTTGTKRASRVTKPMAGHFAKAGVPAGRGLWEFPLNETEVGLGLNVGSELKVDFFKVGQYVDVTGTSKGKGFAGVIKRHHFTMGDATHGNSLSHRAPGSIGQRQTPGRVFKGKKMAGQMGNVQRTIQTQEVIRVDVERNLLLVKGGVPGAPGTDVIIRPAVKAKRA